MKPFGKLKTGYREVKLKMKIKTYILTFFILISGFVFGQDMIVDSLEINRIDRLVNEIRNDSSIKIIQLDDVKMLNRFNKKAHHMVSVRLKNNEIVQIDLTDSSEAPRLADFNVMSISFIRTTYFIDENNLIYAEENYNRTKNKLYYKNAEIIKSVSNDDIINNDYLLNYVIENKEQIYKNFKKIYKVSKRKIK